MAELRPYVYEWPTWAEAMAVNYHPSRTPTDWPKVHGPYATVEQAREVARQINEAKGVA